ncbi:endonuclease NucS [Ancylothrix sp. C2]|uniref:endonuclease NucS domain-containing protein n=1 Tax=Ancylothrix sp. D3o TaxID=2953691 RepID=UPI0021BB1021|nr:endonuclease NucS domain-containing protein [Ancylothrix sp. D3o]MCT7951636.1 endonuclease NucS [Ancylothrix sp. D3o]
MEKYVSLRKTGAAWVFESEATLEDFIWANLAQLFNLTPLKRQFSISGQYCDILAVGENKQLVVLELKNTEDRYVVQQLTRYYDALQDEKPFSEQIDYSLPVRLVAVTPAFHRDNFTDRKYHHLSIDFWQFQILESADLFNLHIKNIDSGEEVLKAELFKKVKDADANLPEPPRLLFKFIDKCNEEEKQAILKLRRQILSFDKRIKEITESGSIKYGRGKTKLFAELRFDNQRNSPALFLWLPYMKGFNTRFTARMRVWTDWENVSDVAYVRKGMGIIISETEFRLGTVSPPAKLLPSRYYGQQARDAFLNDITFRENHINAILRQPQDLRYNGDFPLALSISYYLKLIESSTDFNSLEKIVEMALETRR